MFKEFFKAIYKSKKTVTKEQAEVLETEMQSLLEDNNRREEQIKKFVILIEEDPEYKERYKKRIFVHKGFIDKNNSKIEEIEHILLDK